MSGVASDVCRVTIYTPRRSADVALPVYLPLSDLVPALIPMIDPGLGEQMPGRGVVLQRVGHEPLAADRTPAALGLRDGDVLHMRAADEAMPALRFDDLVDGVAVSVSRLHRRWRTEHLRPLLAASAGVIFALSCILLALAAADADSLITAASLSAALLACGVGADRGFGDRAAGVVLALAACAHAALTGALVPAAVELDLAHPWRQMLLVGGAALFLLSVTARALFAPAGALFLGLGAVAGLATVGGGLAVGFHLTVGQTSVAVVVLALIGSLTTPVVACWLAGLRLPDIPHVLDVAERNVEPLSEEGIVGAARAADRYITALYSAVATATLAGVLGEVAKGSWTALAFGAAVSALLLYRSRSLSGLWQTAAVVCSGVAGLVAVTIRSSGRLGHPWPELFAATAVMTAGIAFLAASRVVVERSIRPYWGRAGEIAESLLALAVVPLALVELDAVAAARHLFG